MAFNPAEHFRKISGGDYLEIKWRLVWFREEHPDWTIETEMISHDTETHTAVFKASILDADGKLIATAHGDECIKDFRDYLCKAESKSVGRALAFLGYGTQFAVELDEGDRIADAPVETKRPAAQPKPGPKPPVIVCTDCGKPIVDTVVGDTTVKRDEILGVTYKNYRRYLCIDCARKAKESNNGGK